MNYLFHKNFLKQLNKLSPSLREKFYIRLRLLLKNPLHPHLHNHVLHGIHRGAFSIDVNGDVRAIYVVVEKDVIQFTHIGTHHQLYGL